MGSNPSRAMISGEVVVMVTVPEVFRIERQGQTLIVTPLRDLRELDYQAIESEGSEILHLLENGTIKNVVMDCTRTDYYGSTALGFFVKLWNQVQGRKGRMAFCGLSDHEREILKVANLDGLWPHYSSRLEAIKAIGM